MDLSLCMWCPWNLVEHRSEWIFQPKTDVLALLSRVCRLPPAAARHLIEEHQAVVLVVIGVSPEGRRFTDANRSDSRAGGWALLDELAERGAGLHRSRQRLQLVATHPSISSVFGT